MPKIVVCYRRKDAPGMARLIFEQLKHRYGESSVFMDIDIPYGANYRAHIEDVLHDSDFLIVVIGPRWLGGRRMRIQEPDDPVRLEIEAAQKSGVDIIPVLVDGARMPSPAQLPDSLKDFHFRNAARVDSGRDFRSHVDLLIGHIDKDVGRDRRSPAPAAASPERVEPRPVAPARELPWTERARAVLTRSLRQLVSGFGSNSGATRDALVAAVSSTRGRIRIGEAWRALNKISWARLGRAFAAIVVAIVCTYALSRLGMLHGLERLLLDWEMTARSRTTSDIAIINISDLEYDDLFGGRSPLDAKKLRSLVDAIARSKPKVIGVDIDTSHPQFRDFEPDPSWPPVVWERDLSSGATGAEIEPADVLGGQDPGLNAGAGIPVLLDDPHDKVTRLYTRCIDTKAGPEPSFVFAAAEAFRRGNTAGIAALCRDGATDLLQPFFIRFSAHWTSLPAAQVRFRSDTKANGGLEQPIAELTGKLVLLGGTYRDFDRHFTPLGAIPGVLVLANAIQTELDGDALRAYPGWALFLLEFGAGAVLVVIMQFSRSSVAGMLILGVPIALGLSLVFSAVTFHSFSRITIFAPTLVAILIVEIFEHVRRRSILRVVHAE